MPRSRNRTDDLNPLPPTYKKKPRDTTHDWPMPPKPEVKEEQEPKAPVVTPKTGKTKK